ncbi:MAG TPA: class I SAM-dependent methyltransferase [Polyangiales bacterium]|nr:class I SAM-dependent methyltransferase [Polyangiales bacterium]
MSGQHSFISTSRPAGPWRPASPHERVNRDTYASRRAVRMYQELSGYTDPGEQAALERVAGVCRDRPILDLGVGAGRTIPLLRQISRDYVAVDYTPALVDACRARYPGVDVRVGDARDLSAFPGESFALVVFSWNGIDSVDHRDRLTILREIQRVLAPDGICVFSAHNYDGPVNHPGRHELPDFHPSVNPLKLARRSLEFLRQLAMGMRNHRRNRALELRTDDYRVANSGAHEYGLLIHHIRLDVQQRQLAQLGFEQVEVLSCVDGHELAVGEDSSAITWFHFIARKRVRFD